MPDLIRVKRGNKANLPALNDGEFGLCEDTREVNIGTTGGNLKLSSIISGGHKVQSGSGSGSLTPNTQGTATITFPTAFGTAPIVLVGMNTNFGSVYAWISAQSITTTGFTAIYQSGASGTMSYTWIAIGT